jgi:hypothetical protein
LRRCGRCGGRFRSSSGCCGILRRVLVGFFRKFPDSPGKEIAVREKRHENAVLIKRKMNLDSFCP